MKTNNVVKLGEVTRLLNVEGFTGRAKKAAAKFVAMFEGYETARANTQEDCYSDIGIITTTPNGNRIVIWWDSNRKLWDAYSGKNYTPAEYDLSQLRREVQKSFQDKHFYTAHYEVSNRAVKKFKQNRIEKIRKQLQAAKDEVRRLEKLYYSTPSY